MGLFVTLAMNPTMEKMTKPANMLVKEFMQQTMTESLYGRDKAQGSHCHADISSLSTSHTLWNGEGGKGGGAILSAAAAPKLCKIVSIRSQKMAGTVIKIAGIRDKSGWAVRRLKQTSDSAEITKHSTQLETMNAPS